MARDRDEVLEVARWAKGIEGVHGCIAGRFYRWEPRRRATPHPTGYSGCCPPIAGKPVWLAGTSVTRWWSIWATPLGCWWWTRPGSLKKGAKSVGVQQWDGGTD